MPPDEIGKYSFGSITLRFDQIKMLHRREVFSLDDLFGQIAGIWEQLYIISIFLFGSTIYYSSTMRWIKGFYNFK